MQWSLVPVYHVHVLGTGRFPRVRTTPRCKTYFYVYDFCSRVLSTQLISKYPCSYVCAKFACGITIGLRRNFSRGAISTFYLSCSCCWRCNANARSQNALPFLHYNENAPCYGSGRKNRASLAQQCFFFIHASFHAVQNYEAYRYQQSLSRSIFCQRCLRSTISCVAKRLLP